MLLRPEPAVEASLPPLGRLVPRLRKALLEPLWGPWLPAVAVRELRLALLPSEAGEASALLPMLLSLQPA